MPVLQDKAVLVTGAGAGIGRATALAMAAEGAMIAAADIDLAAAERTAGQAAGNSRRAIAIEADCGDVASIEAMVARALLLGGSAAVCCPSCCAWGRAMGKPPTVAAVRNGQLTPRT